VNLKEKQAYEDGLRDGQILALEKTVGEHQDRMNNHAIRLSKLERVMYMMGGVIIFLEIAPVVKTFFAD